MEKRGKSCALSRRRLTHLSLRRSLSSVGAEEFAQYARAGIPVVVTDALRGSPLASWSCETIAADFEQYRMRREYVDSAGDPRGTGERVEEADDGGDDDGGDGGDDGDDNPIRIGDAGWITDKVPNGAPGNADGPHFAPLYWDVKEGPGPVQEVVRGLTQVPYFMRDTAPNHDAIFRSPEVWLAPEGAGAKAHADEHCEATMSLQLSGAKLWRIGPMPALEPANFSRRRSLADGVVTMTKAGWTPAYETVLQPGEGERAPPAPGRS